MKTACLPSDRVTSKGAHADTEYQLRHPNRHYIHEHGVPDDKTCILRRQAGKRYVIFLLLGGVVRMDILVARSLSTLLML